MRFDGFVILLLNSNHLLNIKLETDKATSGHSKAGSLNQALVAFEVC